MTYLNPKHAVKSVWAKVITMKIENEEEEEESSPTWVSMVTGLWMLWSISSNIADTAAGLFSVAMLLAENTL